MGADTKIEWADATMIPIFNLQRHDHREAWEEVIR